MKIHELKTVNPYFQDVWDKKKNFELRKNDRGFKAGDKLILKEYDEESKKYTNRNVECFVQYVVHGPIWGLSDGYCIMGIWTAWKIENGNIL